MFKVCSGQCDECLFSENRIVDKARKNQIIRDCLKENSFFVCHKGTLTEQDDICCRGFFDSYGPQINLIRIAQRLHAIEEVDVDELSRQAEERKVQS